MHVDRWRPAAQTGCMRVAVASLAFVALTSGAWAQNVPSAVERAVALHRVIFNGEPDAPRTQEEFDALTELALAYRTGSGVAPDIDVACALVYVAAMEAGRLMPDTPTASRTSEVRGLVCAEVRDITVAFQMLGCPTFGLTPHTFALGSAWVATIDRHGIRLDTPKGSQLHPLHLSCAEIVVSTRHRHVDPPPGASVPARDFLELTTWLPKYAHSEPDPHRTLMWRLIALDYSDTEPAHEGQDLVTEPAWAWPTPPLPPEFADGASLRMLPTGEVRWRFERASHVGTGVIAVAR